MHSKMIGMNQQDIQPRNYYCKVKELILNSLCKLLKILNKFDMDQNMLLINIKIWE